MTIEYLTQVVENPVLDGFKNRPLSLESIIELEREYNNGKEFPKAFREFLHIAGDFNNFSFDDLGNGLDELQKLAKKELDLTGQKVERKFFAFSVYDSQYSVIFLDETKADPKVYIIRPYEAFEEGSPLIKPNGWNFTALVNESIRRVKNNIPF